MDFNFVTDRVATGAALSGPADVAALVAAGITAVIDCRSEFDDTPLFASGGIAVLWNGVADDGNPSTHGPDWFGKSLAFALPILAAPHGKVLAHCAAGVNRGPSTAYAILRAQGLSAVDAEAMIRRARPQVGLAYKTEADSAITVLGYT